MLALVNDTVGTLVAGAYSDQNTRIGLILGTGSNACYLEKTRNIKTLSSQELQECEEMVVNMEWGAFGSNGCLDFIRTVYDYEIDQCSLNPKKQM